MEDVIVIGAGPAGAITAYLLAKGGFQVCLLEKATLPRYKACGGGLTWKTIHSLPFDVSPAVQLQAAGGIVTFGGKPLLKVDVHQPFASLVMRSRFDQYLVEQAVAAGARLVERVNLTRTIQAEGYVEAETNNGKFRARFLVGADGVNSIVARSNGLMTHRQAATALEAEISVPSRALESQGPYATFDFGAFRHGYAWIFPKKDHLSVGIMAAHPGKAPGLKAALDRFISSQPVLAGGRITELHGHRIPLGGQSSPLHCGRVLLVGDAANLADPWLGEGIYYAILSARQAAEILASALTTQDRPNLSAYTQGIDATIRPQLVAARRWAGLVYAFPRQGSYLLSRSPTLQAAVFDLMRGELTFTRFNHLLMNRLFVIWRQALLSPAVQSHPKLEVR